MFQGGKYIMKLRLIWQLTIMLGVFVLTKLVAATDTLCYGDYQFKSYPSALQWGRAWEMCEIDFNGYLAKVDSVDLAKKIQETMPTGSSHIGGRRNVGQPYQWKDGTGLSGDLFFNENGINFTCLILFSSSDDRNVPHLASADCSIHRKYICQKDKSPPTIESDQKIISSADESITCNGCAPTWITEDVATIPLCGVQSDRICQYISSTGSRLRFTNASEGDSGVYSCKTLSDPATFQAVEVKVLGKSKINEIVTSQCSANSTVKWTPGRYGDNYTHTITLSDGQHFDFEPEDENEQSFELTTLLDSTVYTLNISTCETNCTHNFSPSSASFITGGTPNNISNLTSTPEKSNQCRISWNPPHVSFNSTSYKIRILGMSLSYRSGAVHESQWYNNTTNRTYIFNVRPNMRYEVDINAVYCEKSGHRVRATADCVRPPSAPELVSTPQLRQSSPSDFPILKLKVPEEHDGLISCILIMVSYLKKDEGMLVTQQLKYNDLQSLRSSFTSPQNNTKYIAVAISPIRFTASADELDIPLGDESISSCDLTQTATSERAVNHLCEGRFVCGNNHNLRDNLNIVSYVAVIVPSNGSFSVSTSNITTFTIVKQGLPSISQALPFALGGTGVFLVVVTAILVIVMLRRKRNAKRTSDQLDIAEGNPTFESAEPTPSPTNDGVDSMKRRDYDCRNGRKSYVSETVTYENHMVGENDGTLENTRIKIGDLEAIYANGRENKNEIFSAEFKRMVEESSCRAHTTDAGADPSVKSKNRYKNILPYDYSRVTLRDSSTGYINACYVDGYDVKAKFIATQGPLNSTIEDFWLMVLENGSTIIVMLTRTVESGKNKSERYWPTESDKSLVSGSLTVENLKETSHGGYKCRHFKVSNGAQEVITTQYHFTSWPDHGAPQMTSHLVHMYQAMTVDYQQNSNPGPIIVHCSAGAGRTGTYIGYDILLEEKNERESVDVFECVMNMREQRIDMVQNADQYVFLHKLILESHIYGNTDMDATQFQREYQDLTRPSVVTKLHRQFQIIGKVLPLNTASVAGLETSDYDEIDGITSYEFSKVLITMDSDECRAPNFDASWIQTEDPSFSIIAAPTPKQDKVDLFWRAVTDNNITTVVDLDCDTNSTNKFIFMPTDSDTLSLEHSCVTLESVQEGDMVTETHLKVKRLNGDPHSVSVIQFKAWNQTTYPCEGSIISLADQVKDTTKRSELKSVLVHSCDLVGRVAIFCVVLNILDRARHDGRIDILRAVKDIRDARPGMIRNEDDYVFCHRVLLTYLDSVQLYSIVE